jgi:3-phosphoinositide dependent protein kinase-1
MEDELINGINNLNLEDNQEKSEESSSKNQLFEDKETQINESLKEDHKNSENKINNDNQNISNINSSPENSRIKIENKEENINNDIDLEENININQEKENNNIINEKEDINKNSSEKKEEIKKPERKSPKIIPIKTKKEFKNEDFEVISLSGKGAYGTVLKVKLKSDTSDKLLAIKIMDIKALTKIKKLYQAYLECDILSQINSPYIVDILGSFIEHGKIHIVMDYLSKGDFSDFIRLNFPLKIDTIQFYAAEIVNFLEYIQSKKIVHRDLKPENIMMNEKWHLQVIDFGTARILGKYFDKENMEFKDDDKYDLSETDDLKGTKIAINEEDEDDDDFFEDAKAKPERRGMTFVGTAEYVSPEVLGDKPAEFGADIWALGIMIYQMFFGKTPFKERTNYLIFRKIEQMKIDFGDGEKIKISEEAKDLITKILVKEPTKRLGAGEPGSEYDISHLKSHPFFKGINWKDLHNLTPPNSENFDFLLNQKNKSKNKVEENNNTKEENKNEEKEIILKEGELEKKSPYWHYNTRKVILYSTPKIVYIDPSNNKVKGEIYLDKSSKVIHISTNVFEIVSPKRNFKFKSPDALVWEKFIADAIKKYGK